MNPYHEEKRRVNSLIKIKGCVIVFFSVIIYFNPEYQFTWGWANIGFFASELIRDFKHWIGLRKLLSRKSGDNEHFW